MVSEVMVRELLTSFSYFRNNVVSSANWHILMLFSPFSEATFIPSIAVEFRILIARVSATMTNNSHRHNSKWFYQAIINDEY